VRARFGFQIVITKNESEYEHHRSWRPTGCALRYHPSTGLPITKPELVELTSGEGELGGGFLMKTTKAARFRKIDCKVSLMGNEPVRLCVQRRLACSAGERPAGAKIRTP